MKRSRRQLTRIRKQLLALRNQLEADLAHFDAWSISRLGFGNSLTDDAAASFDQATQLTPKQNTEQRLAQVRQALTRLESGIYGLCECCGEAIDSERMQALLDARLCLACKRLEERSPLGRLTMQAAGGMA